MVIHMYVTKSNLQLCEMGGGRKEEGVGKGVIRTCDEVTGGGWW